MLLEVIVQSVADALAAEAGGADRLEVVRDLARDGLTPSPDLVRAIGFSTRLPLRVMVRESDGFTIGSARELGVLQRAVAAFARLGVDGAVVGFARDGALDLDTLQAVLSAAPELPVTLHRAFDAVLDPLAAIDTVAGMPQIDRILTSGGSGSREERCERWRHYTVRARGRMTILAGGGIDEGVLHTLAITGTVREAHVGRAAREPPIPTAPVSAERVRRLREIASTR